MQRTPKVCTHVQTHVDAHPAVIMLGTLRRALTAIMAVSSEHARTTTTRTATFQIPTKKAPSNAPI